MGAEHLHVHFAFHQGKAELSHVPGPRPSSSEEQPAVGQTTPEAFSRNRISLLVQSQVLTNSQL